MTPSGPAYVYRATVDRVIDGDTYVLDVDLGFKVHAKITVRLRGVNCPELSTDEGKTAASWVADEIVGQQLLIQSYKDQQSFARWVCDVYLTMPSGAITALADGIISSGHGVVYP